MRDGVTSRVRLEEIHRFRHKLELRTSNDSGREAKYLHARESIFVPWSRAFHA